MVIALNSSYSEFSLIPTDAQIFTFVCNHIPSFNFLRWRSYYYFYYFICVAVVAIVVIIIILLLLYTFKVDILFTPHCPRGHNMSCHIHHLERANSKPFVGWIGLTRVAISRLVAHKSRVARCSPRAPAFNRSN